MLICKYANENACDAKIEFLVTNALTFQQNNGRVRVFSPTIVNGEGLPFVTLMFLVQLSFKNEMADN